MSFIEWLIVSAIVLILWDGIRPTDEEFLVYAFDKHGVEGEIFVNNPCDYAGMVNVGTCYVIANT